MFSGHQHLESVYSTDSPTGRLTLAMAREFLELRLEPIWQSSTSDDEFFSKEMFFSFFLGGGGSLVVCLFGCFFGQLSFNVGMKRIRRFLWMTPDPHFQYCLANVVYTEG